MPPLLTKPHLPILEITPTELIGADEQVDQDEYSASVGVPVGSDPRPASGEILHVTLYTAETGTGAVLTPVGVLYVLDADPATAAGDTAITAVERKTIIAQIPVAAADWKADANGASVSVHDKPIAFHSLTYLYFLWFHEDATSFNDAAGDDEVLVLNAWFRRDS